MFEDLLLMYFENLGEVENVALDMKKGEALVTFANPSGMQITTFCRKQFIVQVAEFIFVFLVCFTA